MRRYIMGVSSVVSLAVLLGPVIALAAAFTNGSFESSPIDPGAFSTVTAGDSTTITGWTVLSGSVDYIGTYWTASNGSRSLDLSGNEAGTITQTFDTVIGATYTVTFDLSGNPAGGPALKVVNVSATGGATTPFSYDTAAKVNTLTDMKWDHDTYTFTATAVSTTLTFASQTAGFFGPALDNVAVSLTQNPTPITVDQCKNGGWMSLSDGQGNTFKNQGDCVSFVATKNKNLGAIAPTI